MAFTLHSNLQSKIFVADLPLCRVLLEDNHHYPWLFLVPRRADVSKMIDLSTDDQQQLMRELDFVQKIVWREFQPTQLNVAAIGNKTPQLHIHIIARYDDDPAWPGTVWDNSTHVKCDEELKQMRIEQLQKTINSFESQ
jgi:diadenosine tetraphosphate (Ap4A) HIT family hydrolase